MGLYLNPGNDSFREAVKSEIYIDKSLLIAYTNKVIGTAQKAICVSRPRRFGKSIAADMLTAYYGKGCDSSTLFSDLKIAQDSDYQKYLNQEYVIHVDINAFLHRRNPQTRQMVTALEAIDLFHMEIISELRNEFPNSVDETMIDLPSALAKVSDNEKVKFVIIIDEWDAIFREEKKDIKAQEVYLDLLRGLFKDAPSKKFLKLAYITGILPIKKYGTQSALNNFDEFTMIQSAPISEFVGFTEEEVEKLYSRYGMNFEEAKRWYDGYVLGDDLHMYNPKSVVDSIRRKKIANYWTRTESYESLRDYIDMNYDGLKDAIVNMLAGGKCKVNASRFQNDMTSLASKDDILTLLIHLGYLAYDEKLESVYIPNEEILNEFETAIEGANWSSVVEAIKASDRLLQDTWEMNEDAVAEAIEKIHMDYTSILQYNDENSLSCVISLAYYNAINEYSIIRELPTGKGFADVAFIPRKKSDKPAMIIELKMDDTPERAVSQIKERKYSSALKDYDGNILVVGISYDKSKKVHQCKIEKM